MKVSLPRAAAAGFVGALLEWYDFYIFATASALVFGRVFFPADDALAGTMASFGTLAAGFIARPVGGLIFGHIGDRLGRKVGLIATLLIIGIGTFLIGLLPSTAQAGVIAPILLVILRVVQGIGLGGEYGGAALIAIEHAPHAERGFWGSLPQAASPGGLLLSSAVFGLVSLLPDAQFLAWGWRIPFLLSLLLTAVGLYVRLNVAETPEFTALHPAGKREAPVLQILRRHKQAALLATGARLAETVVGNTVKSFGLSYVTVELGVARAIPLGALMATAAVGLLATPLFGMLGDRFGRRRVYCIGALLAAVLSFPFFALLNLRTALAVWLGFICIYNLGPTLMLSVQATFFAEMFGAGMRYTALSVAYQVSAILGGFTPLIAISLLRAEGGAPWGVAGLLAGVSLLSLACARLTRRLAQ